MAVPPPAPSLKTSHSNPSCSVAPTITIKLYYNLHTTTPLYPHLQFSTQADSQQIIFLRYNFALATFNKREGTIPRPAAYSKMISCHTEYISTRELRTFANYQVVSMFHYLPRNYSVGKMEVLKNQKHHWIYIQFLEFQPVIFFYSNSPGWQPAGLEGGSSGPPPAGVTTGDTAPFTVLIVFYFCRLHYSLGGLYTWCKTNCGCWRN